MNNQNPAKSEEEESERTELVTGRATWFRYSSYELVERDGTYYVRPSLGATVGDYRPMKEPDILVSYLNLALSLTVSSSDERSSRDPNHNTYLARRNAERVLAFCNNYGLIGVLWRSVSWWNHQAKTVGIGESIYEHAMPTWAPKHGELSFDEFAARFFYEPSKDPFDMFLCRSKAQPFIDTYAEPVGAIQADARQLFWLAEEWHRFRSGGYLPDSPLVHVDGTREKGRTWRQHLSIVEAPNVTLRLDFGPDGKQLDYVFDSLSSALQILFVLNVVSEDQRVRLCAECGNPFRTENTLKQYCGVRCSNRIRHRRYREKLKSDRKKGGKK